MKKSYNHCKFLQLFLSVLFLSNGCNAFAQSKIDSKAEVNITKEDKKNAAERTGGSEKNELDKVTGRHLDGVKGTDFIISSSPPPHSNIISDPLLNALRFYACNAAAFGEYRLIGQVSFADENGNQIFTKRRFKLIEDWAVRSDQAKPEIEIVMLGGEIKWKGEKIRIENSFQKYKVGRNYILAIGDRLYDDQKIIQGETLFLEVDNGVIYPGEGWTLFERGTSTEVAKSKIEHAISLARCAR